MKSTMLLKQRVSPCELSSLRGQNGQCDAHLNPACYCWAAKRCCGFWCLPALGLRYTESGSRYIAHCGVFEVDEEKETVTHIPSVALLPNLIHGRQLRLMTLSDENLTLRAASSPEADGVTSVLYWNKAISYDANNGRKE